eukprot:458893_1
MDGWSIAFQCKGNIYALENDTDWVSRGQSGNITMLQNHSNTDEIRIKFEKIRKNKNPLIRDEVLWWRVAASKIKPKGKHALVIKVWTMDFDEEVLAIRFKNQQTAAQFESAYHKGVANSKHCLVVNGYTKQILNSKSVKPNIMNEIVFYYSKPLLLKIKDETDDEPNTKPILYSPVTDDWSTLINKIKTLFDITDVQRLRTLFYGRLGSIVKQEINAKNWARIVLDSNTKHVFVIYGYKWLCHKDESRNKVYYERMSNGFVQWERPPEPVQPNWIGFVDANRGLYFKNIDNSQTMWDRPIEFRDANDQWIARVDGKSGAYYYQNIETEQTQWEVPECFAPK